jgi:hypothetical protein
MLAPVQKEKIDRAQSESQPPVGSHAAFCGLVAGGSRCQSIKAGRLGVFSTNWVEGCVGRKESSSDWSGEDDDGDSVMRASSWSISP